MAFNFGNIGASNLGEPRLEAQAITPNIGPKRKISLTEEEEERVQNIKDIFGWSGFDTELLYNFFREWQSSKTKSVKRFVLSFSFILSLSYLAGVAITDIDLFGVEVADGREILFLSSLILIHIISFFYFYQLSSIDWDVHLSKINPVEESLEKYIKLSHEIEKIVRDNNISSVEALFDDFRNTLTDMNSDEIGTYDAIKFYEENLKRSHDKIMLGEYAESIAIYLLVLTGLISIVCSF